MGKNNVLALDIASRTGWCTSIAHGVWDLRPKRDESKGMRLIRLNQKLREIISSMQINFVVFEMAAGLHHSSIATESEMIGVVKLFCEQNGITYRSYTPTEVKKFATGKGNASKDLMILSAKDKLGYDGFSNDEADAMWLYKMAEEYIEL